MIFNIRWIQWTSPILLSLVLGCSMGEFKVEDVTPKSDSDHGSWDLRDSFPGAGNYTAVSNLPASSQLCSGATGGQNVAGIIGTATCQTGNPTDAATATHVLLNKEFWNSTGTLQTGTMPNRGTWNLTTSFPGVGYYAGVSSTPASTDIRSGASILGVSGDANVVNTSSGDAVAGDILTGKKAWVDGNEVTGTITTSGPTQTAVATGSENNDAVTSVTVNPSAGSLFSSFTVNLGLSFTRENICDGKTIFGRLGTAACMHLIDFSMHDVGSTTKRQIPKISDLENNIPDVNHTILNACGTTQNTVAARIANCATVNGSNATWIGSNNTTTNYGTWKLVTKTASGANGKEVWRDERTRMLWGDTTSPLSGGWPNGAQAQGEYNWCMASGNTEDGSGYSSIDCSVGVSGSWNEAGVSICAEDSSVITPDGIHNTSTPGNNIPVWISTGTDIIDAKGGMKKTATGSSPSITWRLPLREDFFLATINGGMKVLPRMTWLRYYTATIPQNANSGALIFGNGQGTMIGYNYYRWEELLVRCVGFE